MSVKHQPSVELHGVANRQHRQGRVQGIGVRDASGLQHGGLCVQAGKFGIHKLQAAKLRFGLIAERVDVVVLVVDGDVRLVDSFEKYKNDSCLRKRLMG